MKLRGIISLALILISAASFSQAHETFRVITVSGSVENTKTKKPVQAGDRISTADALKFGSKNAYLIVISPKTGRKTIRGVPDASARELETLLKSFLKPDEKSTATRGLEIEYWEALNQSLKDTVLILGDGIIPLDQEYINLKSPAVIVAFYKGKDNKHITQVVSKGQVMCLSKKCLFSETPELHSYVLVEYYDDEKESRDLPGSGKYIGYFIPVYPSESNLEKEARIIADAMKDSSRDTIIKEIKKYLAEEYGQVQDDNLLKWLKDMKLITP